MARSSRRKVRALCHLLKRGDVKRPGEEMKPAAVVAVPGVTAEFQISDLKSEGERRSALAKWITNTNNLLTRRSIVNRVWHYHFGRGLVETPNDFGRMGGLPSHPELLDWLAFWFLENGESLKKLHRLIVTSATYRQSSLEGRAPRVPGFSNGDSYNSSLQSDSANRLLWRMNRARLGCRTVPRRAARHQWSDRLEDGRPIGAAIRVQGRSLAGL